MLLCYSTFGATSWRHVDIHRKLEHPFHFISPHRIAFSHGMHGHRAASLTSPTTGKIPAGVPIRFRATFLPSHGFIPSTQGYVLFDAYANGKPTQTILAQKHATSKMQIQKFLLQADMFYTTGADWQFTITNKNKDVLFSRSRKALGAAPLTQGPILIGLYDIVLHQKHGAPYGWAIILENSLRLCVPYVDNKQRLYIWSEGFTCLTSQKNKQLIMHQNKDGSLDIWGTYQQHTLKGAQIKTIAIPIVTRIYFHTNRAPHHISIAPPGKHALWPEEAQKLFSWDQKYLAALVYNLPEMKQCACKKIIGENLKKQKAIADNLASIGYTRPLSYDTLMHYKKPSILKSPLHETPSHKHC